MTGCDCDELGTVRDSDVMNVWDDQLRVDKAEAGEVGW
jgi:hypothetical protein